MTKGDTPYSVEEKFMDIQTGTPGIYLRLSHVDDKTLQIAVWRVSPRNISDDDVCLASYSIPATLKERIAEFMSPPLTTAQIKRAADFLQDLRIGKIK